MPKNLRILVDVDGIVANSMPRWLSYIRKLNKVKVRFNQIDKWDLEKCPPLRGCKHIYDILQIPGFTAGIEPMSGASKNLKKLQNTGYEIYFVTARNGITSMSETYLWFKQHFSWVDQKQIIFCYDKYLISGDILIDDKSANLSAYGLINPDAHLLSIRYPYNSDINQEAVDTVKRGSKSWDLLYKKIIALG